MTFRFHPFLPEESVQKRNLNMFEKDIVTAFAEYASTEMVLDILTFII